MVYSGSICRQYLNGDACRSSDVGTVSRLALPAQGITAAVPSPIPAREQIVTPLTVLYPLARPASVTADRELQSAKSCANVMYDKDSCEKGPFSLLRSLLRLKPLLFFYTYGYVVAREV